MEQNEKMMLFQQLLAYRQVYFYILFSPNECVYYPLFESIKFLLSSVIMILDY